MKKLIVKTKTKLGRKPFIFDNKVLKKIEELAACGLTIEGIATSIGISRSLLHEKMALFLDILDPIKRGRAKGAAKVAHSLMDLCIKGNLGAIIWYEKTRCGRSERIEVNNTETITPKYIGMSRSLELLGEYQASIRAKKPDEDDLSN